MHPARYAAALACISRGGLLFNSSSQCQACSCALPTTQLQHALTASVYVCVCCPFCCCACTPMRTVMLAAPVRIVDGNWRRAFASTGGVATQAGRLPPLTITSGKHCPGHKQAKRTCQCRPLACVLLRIRTQPFSSGCDSFSATV